jgi:hypothetical protein
MKKIFLTGLTAMAALAALAQDSPFKPAFPAQPRPDLQPPQSPPVYQAPPPVAFAPPPAAAPNQSVPVYVYDQKPLAAAAPLVSAEQAQSIVEQFHTNYPRLGSPRILIYVNRDLVDETSGMKLSGHSERVETTSTNGSAAVTRSVVKNNYHDNGQPAPALADRQTVRDVERLIGRPLRAAGATLVDQRVATQLMGDRPLESLGAETDQARKDREAIGKIADVVLEVLMSSHNVNFSEVSGDNKMFTAPDLQITAIRLKDAKIIGQASASDVMNKAGGPVNAARNFSVQDITECTALSLMDDMLTEAK